MPWALWNYYKGNPYALEGKPINNQSLSDPAVVTQILNVFKTLRSPSGSVPSNAKAFVEEVLALTNFTPEEKAFFIRNES